jgi:hypothetical protein
MRAPQTLTLVQAGVRFVADSQVEAEGIAAAASPVGSSIPFSNKLS